MTKIVTSSSYTKGQLVRIVNLKKRLKDDQFSTLGDNKYFSKDIYKHKTYIGLALLL